MRRRDFSKLLLATAAVGADVPPPRSAATPTATAPHFERTATEGETGAKVADPQHPPGVVDRYAVNQKPGQTDMSEAVQYAVRANREVAFLEATYLLSDVVIDKPVTFRGQGVNTVLLAKTDQMDRTRYSRNIFTATATLDSIAFDNLTLDGGCDNANGGHPHELSLVKITNTAHVTFNRVKLTRYCGGWDGTPKPVSASFWQAITIQNAAKCEFLHCLFSNNHYEMVLVWNGPNSTGETIVDSCTEVNSGMPNSHTAFDISGGHVTVSNCTFRNTGATSCIAIQVPCSARIINNEFLDQMPGAAAQINVGQDIFPYNTHVLIQGNYCRNANQAAISVGQGFDIVIQNNVIDNPESYGVKITAAVTDFSIFSKEYPEWPVPLPTGSSGITIAHNVINGTSNAGALSKAIYLHTVKPAAGHWYDDVQITANTVTASTSPHDTFWGMVLHDLQNAVIRDNRLQYTKSGIRFETLAQNVCIENNIFDSVPPFAGSDIIWTGPFYSHNIDVRNNRFEHLPVGLNSTINVFSGAVRTLSVIDNQGMHPTRPIAARRSTTFTARQSAKGVMTSLPTSGDWGINDEFTVNSRSGQLTVYICTVAGSFGSELACMVSGTAGCNFFTASDLRQIHVGLHFLVSGAGASGQALRCTCTYLEDDRAYVDQIISRSINDATMVLVEPTFVKSGNPA